MHSSFLLNNGTKHFNVFPFMKEDEVNAAICYASVYFPFLWSINRIKMLKSMNRFPGCIF